MLVVDDEAIIAELWILYVELMGLEVCGAAATADQAIALAEAHRPAVVLMDMRLAGQKDGVDAALAIHDSVGSRVIFITGSQEPATLARINTDHPSAVLIKPVAEPLLRRTVNAALADCGMA
ncbi:response regulator [Caulobacter sp. KR2-114]|uniref:response regulator n=1 Tax=Caulobacter sp. KR2-114 TaxID=3400912 RepID=UPI003BFB426D